MGFCGVMECRRARNEDYPKVVALQNANLGSVLADAAKADGFLSGSFSEADYAKMDRSVCVVVSVSGEDLHGFLAVGSAEFNKPFPLPAAMLAMFPSINYKGKTLDQYTPCIAGPVCVDKNQRGKGIFQAMYAELFKILPAHINLITTLVSTANPRSLKAHENVGLERVSEFEFNGRTFVLLVCSVERT